MFNKIAKTISTEKTKLESTIQREKENKMFNLFHQISEFKVEIRRFEFQFRIKSRDKSIDKRRK